MKFILTWPIRIYWACIRPSNRRRCIHRISCSQYVFTKTQQEGLLVGMRALAHRVRTCRGGYELITLQNENQLLLTLRTGEVLQEHEISENILSQFRTPIDGITISETEHRKRIFEFSRSNYLMKCTLSIVILIILNSFDPSAADQAAARRAEQERILDSTPVN